MKAADFGRSLPRGIGLNLLGPELAPMDAFCREVLGGRTLHADEDFAALELLGSVFMLHADHSYEDHEMAARSPARICAAPAWRSGSTAPIPTRSRDGPGRAATRCFQRRSTSRTACANATSAGHTGMFLSPERLSAAEWLVEQVRQGTLI